MLHGSGNNSAYNAAIMDAKVSSLRADFPGRCTKGVPPSFNGRYADIGKVGLSLASGKLPMPVALVRQDAMYSNSAWMRRFLEMSGIEIAPHGKTTMSPEIIAMQMRDGAWGLTAATAQQLCFFADLGVRRIILANQIVGAGNIGIVLDTVARYPDLVIYCIVDSIENIDMLAEAVTARGGKPLNILIEIGAKNGRTGTRSASDAIRLARLVNRREHALRLAGIEAYEGVFGGGSQKEREEQVANLLDQVREVATRCDEDDLFQAEQILLSAGGTEFFDMAGDGLVSWYTKRRKTVVIRSGCYITHDSVAYERAHRRMVERTPSLRAIEFPLTAAIEIWAAIQSKPEPGLAFATLGKRDVSFDWHMPVPMKWFRPAAMSAPEPVPPGHTVTKLNDQHAFMAIPENSPLLVGDLIGFGVSHVCTTFDKWRAILVVDENYLVTDSIRTFF